MVSPGLCQIMRVSMSLGPPTLPACNWLDSTATTNKNMSQHSLGAVRLAAYLHYREEIRRENNDQYHDKEGLISFDLMLWFV